MKLGDIVKVGDFCKVVKGNDKLPKGTEVYVAGSSMLPKNEKNPYDYYKYLIVAKIVDGHIDPSGGIMLDPRNLRKLLGKRHEELHKQYELDFGDDATAD